MESHTSRSPYRSQAARSRTSRLAWRAAAALLLGAGLAAPSIAAERSWIGFDGSWFDPTNWFPNGVPSVADDAYIGNIPQGIGANVELGGAPTATFGFLQVSGGAELDTNGTELVSLGDAILVGAGSRIIARPGLAGPNVYDLQATLAINPDTTLEMRDDVPVRLLDGSVNSGTIEGSGLLQVLDNNYFSNNGLFSPDANESLMVRLNAAGDGVIDLDGDLGNGTLLLNNVGGGLEIIAQSLHDSYSSDIFLAPGANLTMSVADGWTADVISMIQVAGFGIPLPDAVLDGTEATLAGDVLLTPNDAHLNVLADVTLAETVEVDLTTASTLEVFGDAAIQGGVYTLAQDAILFFGGVTEVMGGSFSTISADPSDGRVVFDDQTTWSGTVDFSGFARQNGPAVVGISVAINADVFDMDGSGGGTNWQVFGGCTVNAAAIDDASNTFDGQLTIPGGFFPKLTINLDDPAARWRMNGIMNLSGFTQLSEQRLAGNGVFITGELNVTAGRPVIAADAQFSIGGVPATVDIAPSTTELIMSGDTLVHEDTVFVGDGTLTNAGTMMLRDGVDIAGVSLRNGGPFEIGEQAGSATVPGFEQSAGATWTVGIGGYSPGVEHDQMIVFGGDAIVDGALVVELDNGFEPMLGDSFTILTATGAVQGTFLEEPVTQNLSATYVWRVDYHPNTIVVVLDDITPAPTCCVGNADKVAPGQVDFADVTAVLARWLDPGDGSDPGDANCDGIVDFSDITAVLSNWLNLCP